MSHQISFLYKWHPASFSFTIPPPCVSPDSDLRSDMRTLFYVALIFGLFLPTANTQNWDLNKMRQCACASNATTEIPSMVARGCITDAKGKRVTLRLSPSEKDGCIAEIKDKTYPGEIDVFMIYNGKLEDGTKLAEEKDTKNTGQQDNPDGEMEFTFQVNVENGRIYDPNVPGKMSSSGTKIRKREIMPFSFVNFNIIIKTDEETSCDVKDQTKVLLIKGIKRYWLKMAFCLLDVIE